MIFNSADRIRTLTPQYEGDRLPDGRPFVPDDILERMKLVTNDEAWGVIERGHNYHFNFEGDWINMHPERVLVGRAVTVRYVPTRPDLNGAVQSIGESEKFRQLGRDHHDGLPFRGHFLDVPVDLALRADVDATGWFSEHNDVGSQCKRPTEHNLLLIAT